MRVPRSTASVILAAAACVCMPASPALLAQAPAAAAPAANAVRSVGTVRSVSGGLLALTTDKGESMTVNLPDTVRVVQLAPGSTDLKTAQPAVVGDIAAGDRVLVAGRPGDSGAIIAVRVVLMKGNAIAQSNAERQQDWQRRGSGGVVTAVDTATRTLTLTAGKRQETVTTTTSTVFRRYAPGSVKFEDAKIGSIADVQPGDQVRVRGDKSSDGTSIAAEEIVSGAFRNVAGLIVKVDPVSNTVTLNDLATKKPVSFVISPDSDLRALPPEMAARFAARARAGSPGAPSAGPGAAAGPSGAAPTGALPAGPRPSGAGTAGAGRPAGDLSQIIGRLPKLAVAELKPGEAVMVVASGSSAAGSALTAVTLLSGVEPLLAAAPQGSANSFSISPWSLGGGGGEAGEGAGPQ